MSPLVSQGPPCGLCVQEGRSVPGPADRLGVCPAHYLEAQFLGRLDRLEAGFEAELRAMMERGVSDRIGANTEQSDIPRRL